MPRLRVVVLVAAAFMAACVSSRVAPPAAPPPAPMVRAASYNTAGPWSASPSLFQRVVITSDAVIALSGDGGVRTDTLTSTLGATFTWTSRGHRRVDGSLVDYRLAVGRAPAAPLSGLTLPHAFSAETVDGSLALRFPAEAAACTDPSHSALQSMHDVWIPLPDTLRVGQEWSDTVRTLSCRERVMLRGVSVRRFRVVRGDVENGNRLVVLIDRIARTRLTGDGDQFGEPVTLAGEGSGALRYVFDPLLGQFVRAEGTASLSMSFSSARRKQRVQQDARIAVRWTP